MYFAILLLFHLTYFHQVSFITRQGVDLCVSLVYGDVSLHITGEYDGHSLFILCCSRNSHLKSYIDNRYCTYKCTCKKLFITCEITFTSVTPHFYSRLKIRKSKAGTGESVYASIVYIDTLPRETRNIVRGEIYGGC